jgi:hypothetical protein
VFDGGVRDIGVSSEEIVWVREGGDEEERAV